MSSALPKEAKKLVKAAKKWEGWRVEEKKNGWMLYPPNKEYPGVMIHKTMSEQRGWQNKLSELRRYGAPI